MDSFRSYRCWLAVSFLLGTWFPAQGQEKGDSTDGTHPILQAMQEELQRSMAVLGQGQVHELAVPVPSKASLCCAEQSIDNVLIVMLLKEACPAISKYEKKSFFFVKWKSLKISEIVYEVQIHHF